MCFATNSRIIARPNARDEGRDETLSRKATLFLVSARALGWTPIWRIWSIERGTLGTGSGLVITEQLADVDQCGPSGMQDLTPVVPRRSRTSTLGPSAVRAVAPRGPAPVRWYEVLPCCLTFDMNGGWRQAETARSRPLDEGISRHVVCAAGCDRAISHHTNPVADPRSPHCNTLKTADLSPALVRCPFSRSATPFDMYPAPGDIVDSW